ncbi:hypothetical protein BDZ94DRAFT_1313972 [Collybia nuda]|uniref:Uncharacterized protein n=1 Tax=Collybia nuda TaxID=64659 RepID=A0A9P6C9T4_9AGAR|nr:hypothetical protein BDZ94DRAFT_1313972 [Collybia nuda]
MRLSIISVLFLATCTALAAPIDSIKGRQEDIAPGLVLRNGVTYTRNALGLTARSDVYDDYRLERRVNAAKKQANKDARKDRKTAAKAEVQKSKQKAITQANKSVDKATAKTPAHIASAERAGQSAAATKKADMKAASQAKHEQLKAAGKEYKKTADLPARTAQFTVPAGGGKPERTYTGKDVRKANFGSHIKNNSGDRFGKQFNNNPHAVPGPDGSTRPIPGMTGPGHEHPLSPATTFSQMKKDHKAEPARIISQTNNHKGVIAHDQSRTAGHPGENDHFLVHPSRAFLEEFFSEVVY